MQFSSWFDNYAPLVGRIVMGTIFLMSAINKALNFDETVGFILSSGLPYPIIIAVVSIAAGALFGIGLLVGYKTKISAAVLLTFTVAVAYFFHLGGTSQAALTADFSLIAGLLYMTTYGSGPYAADNRRKR